MVCTVTITKNGPYLHVEFRNDQHGLVWSVQTKELTEVMKQEISDWVLDGERPAYARVSF